MPLPLEAGFHEMEEARHCKEIQYIFELERNTRWSVLADTFAIHFIFLTLR
jgi:hypothetical protein